MEYKKLSNRGEKRYRGIYILPNLFTTAALFAGFYAIVQAINGRFEHAAVAIFAAMILDGLDGRVARLTNTQSAFGAEYDSLSDMVSFGVAPALVSYEWAMRDLGKIGWVAAFVYCAGAALRLARFNTNIDVVDKRYFQGLPSPSAAALVAGLVWVVTDNGVLGTGSFMGLSVPYLACVVTVIAGVSMVTNVFFYSGKNINLLRAVPFFVTLFVVALFVVVTMLVVAGYLPATLFGIFVLYALSGYVMALVRLAQRRRLETTSDGVKHD